MGSSRALSRACISQRGRYMLPGGPANAAASAHRDPRARVAARAIAAVAPNFTAVEVDALASRSGQEGCPSQPARSAYPGIGPERRWSSPFRCAHFPGTAEGCPSRRHQPAHDNGKALWGALCLSCGTSPERIAPESLTRSLSDFVHGHISWRTALLPPNRVTALTRLPSRGLRLVNVSLARRKLVGLGGGTREPRHRTAITASSRRPCPAAGSRRIASPA
jgi:hypothetical protein